MPDMLPGKTAPKSIDAAFSDEVKRLDAMGPDPALEEEDDDEVVDDSATPSGGQPAAAAAPAQPAAVKPAAGLDQPTPPAPAAASAAAAAPVLGAAPLVTDDWADTEDVEYEDVDTGEKYVVRAPKKYAAKVKNGYQSRSYTDRKLSSFGKNRTWVEPLIQNGSFDRLAPHLQQIFADPELQNGMAALLNRKAAGLPLDFVDRAAAQAQQVGTEVQRQQQVPPPQSSFDENAERTRLREAGYDEYTINAVMASVKPMVSAFDARYGQIEARLNEFGQTQQTAQQQQQRQAQAQAQMRNVGATARAMLLQWYPNELTEQTPPDVWNRIEQYARNSGMIDQMGFTPGAFTSAYQRMRETGIIQAPGTTLAPSAAVDAVAQVEANARQVAAAAANAVGAQTATPAHTGQPAPSNGQTQEIKPPRMRKLKDGREIPLTPTETAAWMEKNRPKRQAATA